MEGDVVGFLLVGCKDDCRVDVVVGLADILVQFGLQVAGHPIETPGFLQRFSVFAAATHSQFFQCSPFNRKVGSSEQSIFEEGTMAPSDGWEVWLGVGAAVRLLVGWLVGDLLLVGALDGGFWQMATRRAKKQHDVIGEMVISREKTMLHRNADEGCINTHIIGTYSIPPLVA